MCCRSTRTANWRIFSAGSWPNAFTHLFEVWRASQSAIVTDAPASVQTRQRPEAPPVTSAEGPLMSLLKRARGLPHLALHGQLCVTPRLGANKVEASRSNRFKGEIWFAPVSDSNCDAILASKVVIVKRFRCEFRYVVIVAKVRTKRCGKRVRSSEIPSCFIGVTCAELPSKSI